MAATNRLSKTELIEAVASESGLEKKQVNAVLDAVIAIAKGTTGGAPALVERGLTARSRSLAFSN